MCTLSMPQKVIEAVRAHVPELLEGKPTGLPTGKTFIQLADSLQLAPREPGAKLTSSQAQTQSIIGSLKFIEKVMPKLSLPIHRL